MKVKYLVAVVLLLIVCCKKELERLTVDLQGTRELTSTYWIGPVEYEPGSFSLSDENLLSA